MKFFDLVDNNEIPMGKKLELIYENPIDEIYCFKNVKNISYVKSARFDFFSMSYTDYVYSSCFECIIQNRVCYIEDVESIIKSGFFIEVYQTYNRLSALCGLKSERVLLNLNFVAEVVADKDIIFLRTKTGDLFHTNKELIDREIHNKFPIFNNCADLDNLNDEIIKKEKELVQLKNQLKDYIEMIDKNNNEK